MPPFITIGILVAGYALMYAGIKDVPLLDVITGKAGASAPATPPAGGGPSTTGSPAALPPPGRRGPVDPGTGAPRRAVRRAVNQ